MADITDAEVRAIYDEVLSVPMGSGYFDRVAGHEPKNAPGKGLSCALWTNDLRPVPARSGLSTTSLRFVFNLRLYSSMVQDPQDQIDPNLIVASVALLKTFTGDFDLDQAEAWVDLLGAHGEPLSSRAGYLEQDGRHFRVMTLTLPIIRDDAFTQAA